MKKIFIFSIFSLLILFPSFAQKAYVMARICPVFSDAATSSQKLGLLTHSEELTILETKNDWLKIKTPKFEGYVQKIFIGDSPSDKFKSNADNLKDLSSLEARKRSSYYSSSAAAIRGLSSENIRDRENLSFKNYDFESINWLTKNFSYTDEEIIKFAEKEILGL
ncbi:MAG: hypothetical protein A2086_16870 [Spirochaetes bacterium GWD1_27_9]|nr:MAG: hypothetical protein A2Z98_08170 [Spirochaetes bacterium GWB1_27_13]OHD20254.1 MAG: hypothetical protein A2Y34_04955 [Spirochaetes bacterium GWC1_27_15]OHD33461.1 MAG: hypothetical protein A2086_16870 [Spirochaetes bacterium GWD1_27_9]